MSPSPSFSLLLIFFCQNRCCAYATADPEKLDEDQKRTIIQLPEYEAVQKELALIITTLEVILPLAPLQLRLTIPARLMKLNRPVKQLPVASRLKKPKKPVFSVPSMLPRYSTLCLFTLRRLMFPSPI